jgi:hypothetical protein
MEFLLGFSMKLDGFVDDSLERNQTIDSNLDGINLPFYLLLFRLNLVQFLRNNLDLDYFVDFLFCYFGEVCSLNTWDDDLVDGLFVGDFVMVIWLSDVNGNVKKKSARTKTNIFRGIRTKDSTNLLQNSNWEIFIFLYNKK